MALEVQKSTRFAFTAYEAQWHLFQSMPPGIAEWGWQQETCPQTGRAHYQGYIRLHTQQRITWLIKLLPGVHLEFSKNWDALVKYCSKADTQVSGTQHHEVSSVPTPYAYADRVASLITARFTQYPSIEEFNWNTWTTDRALQEIDIQVRLNIRSGQRGVEWFASNPNWNAMWRKYWKDIFTRSSRPTG